MELTLRIGAPADLERVLPLLDHEFVFAKGRRISLAQRFPDVYSEENSNNVYIAEHHGEIIGCLVCKAFELAQQGRAWNGTMIGAVYTRPERRGQGIASRLLKYCAGCLSRGNSDFAVLWTVQNEFYERLGWISCDAGITGNFAAAAKSADTRLGVKQSAIDDVDLRHIEAIRRRWCDCFTVRSDFDYRHIPLPAQSIELMFSDGGTVERSGYALSGLRDDTRIVYEIVGHPDTFASLWSGLSSGYSRLLINDVLGSSSQRWLQENVPSAAWEPKPLAMWLPLSSRAGHQQFASWYVPYFDRI